MATASSAFKIKCPSCEAVVTIRDPNLAGKKIDCPKCKYRFVVEPPTDSGGEATAAPATSTATTTAGAKVKSQSAQAKAGEATNGTAKPKGKLLPKREEDEAKPKGKEKKKRFNTTVIAGGSIALLATGVLVWFFVFNGDDDNKGTPAPKGDTGKQQVKPSTTTNTDTNTAGNTTAKKDTPAGKSGDSTADISNLLPGDSQWVLRLNGKQFLETPMGSVVFEKSSDSGNAFKKWTSFEGDDVEKFVCSGGFEHAWFFGVVELNRDLKIEDLKAAMELEAKPETIKKRDLYTIKSNELIKMLGDYAAAKMTSLGMIPPPTKGARVYGLNLLNPRTLVLGDKDVVQQFLNDDAKRKHRTIYSNPNDTPAPPPSQPTNPGGMNGGPNMMPKGGPGGGPNMMPKGGPAGGPNAMPKGGPGGGPPNNPMGGVMPPMNPMGAGGLPNLNPMGGAQPLNPMGNQGTQTRNNEPKAGFSSNPLYLTIDPTLKSMLNQLETERSVVLSLAMRVPDSEKLGMHLMLKHQNVPPNLGELLPKSPMMGLCIRQMDVNKLSVSVALELQDAQTAQAAATLVRQLYLNRIAETLAGILNMQINTGQSPSNPNGGFTGNPNGYMGNGGFPNPMGGFPNPMGGFPNPMAAGGMPKFPNPMGAAGFPNPMGAGGFPNPMGAGGFPNPMGVGGIPNPMGNQGIPPGPPRGPKPGPPKAPTSGPSINDDKIVIEAQFQQPMQPMQPMKPLPMPMIPMGNNGGPPGPPGGVGGNGGIPKFGPPGGMMGNGPPGGMMGNGPPGGMMGANGGRFGPGGYGMAGYNPSSGTNPGPAGQANKIASVTIDASDRLLILNMELDWKDPYYKQVAPLIRGEIDLLKGEALMMTGRAHWHNVEVAVKKLETTGMLPFAAFPRASNSNRFDLPYRPDERVSWMAELLPHLGHDALSRRINRQAAWNDEQGNLQAAAIWVPEFLNPEYPRETWRALVPSLKGLDLGATHFVGLTGIGMDAGNYPDTPEYAKKLGLFGNARQTRIADIASGDGLSNTIFMIQVPPDIQRPWIRGGGSTSQGVPEKGSVKPFVSITKDGKRGTYVMMADGSIRFVSETIDDKVFQALVTYKGGEKVDDLDKLAPRIAGTDHALVGARPMGEPKKEEPKKEEPKKEETKKEELKKEEPKKETPKNEEPKKVEPPALKKEEPKKVTPVEPKKNEAVPTK